MAKDKGKVARLRELREGRATQSPPDPESFYADKVTHSLAKTAEGFIETGRWLIEAKSEIDHGRWTGWIEERLPISETTARELMAIARGLKHRNCDVLPPAKRTLYDLARLDDDEWEAVRPKLSPEMTRSDLRRLLDERQRTAKEPERKSVEQRADEVKRGEKSLSEAAAEERIDDAVDQLPEDERDRARAIIDQPGVPKVDAVDIAHRVASKPQEERLRLYTLNESEDKDEKSLALTEAAGRPPMPHPAIDDLYVARIRLKAARKKLNGDLRDRLNRIVDEVADIDATLSAGGDT